MLKATVIAAGLILGLGAFAIMAHPDIIGKGLFHGSGVNTAVEQRNDVWWEHAHQEVVADSGAFRGASYDPFPPIIWRGPSNQKVVALTFDDGPHPVKAVELVQLLKQLQVKATFFVVGKMAEKHPELIRMEAAAGNEIGDHSFSHVNLSKIPEAEVETEYQACKDLIHHILGYNPRFCRPPGGQATPDVMAGASRCGMTTVMWSDDPRDYANPGSDVIEERTFDHVSNGGVLLFHEGVDETMDILPTVVGQLKAEGYRFVTMSELAEMMKSRPVGASLASMERRSARLVR